MSGIGHNSGDVGGIAAAALRSIVERIERLTEEKKGISDDIRDIFAEAKGQGFDNKIIRQILKRRLMDKADRDEQDTLLQLYEDALISELLS